MAEAARHIAPKIAVGYVRCSTETQEDSPDQQKKEILKFAELKGYTIIDWYEDFGKSGTTFNLRPAFMRLAEDIQKSPKFSTVICYDESRWGRAIDSEENTFWRVTFRQRGIDVLRVKTSVDPTNAFAPIMSSMESVLASEYSKKLSELTLRGAKANGIWSNGGTAPYGYRRIAVDLKTGVERDLADGHWCVPGQEKVRWGLGEKDEIETVRMIFDRRISGAGYGAISMELNRANVPCSKRGQSRNKDQKWSNVTVRTIIENPVYYGARVYNKNSMSKIQASQNGWDQKYGVSYPHWRNDQQNWVIAENAHEPIITKETWLKAYAFRETREAHGKRLRHHSPYLLSGLMKCSRCNYNFQGWSGTSKGKLYQRYIDSGWNNKGICSHMAIKKDVVEEFALKAIRETIADPRLLKSIEEHLRELIGSKGGMQHSELDRLKQEITEKKLKIDRITETIETTGGSQALINRQRVLEEELKGLEAERAGLGTGDDRKQQMNVSEVGKLIRHFLEHFEEVFSRAPVEDRKILIKKLIEQVIVDRDNNVIKFYVRQLPPITPALENLLKKQKGLTTTDVVSPDGSGGRNISKLTTLVRVFNCPF